MRRKASPSAQNDPAASPRQEGRARRDGGFAIGIMLYVLALMALAGGILFSGYSQIMMSNVNVTNYTTARNQILSAQQALANQVTVAAGTGGSATMTPLLGVSFTDASVDAARLPLDSSGHIVSVGELQGTLSPAPEVAVLPTIGGVNQIDPWGHYYIYCSWPGAAGTAGVFTILSAGPDGVMQSNCASSSPQGDNLVMAETVPNLPSAATTWTVDNGGSADQISVGANGGGAKVGINTSNPQYNLDVYGTAEATGSTALASAGGTVTIGGADGVAITSSGAISGFTNLTGGLGTLNGGTLIGSTINGGAFAGTITNSGTISGGTLENSILAGTINASAATIDGGTLAGATLAAGALTGGTTNNGTITGGTLSNLALAGTIANGGTITGGALTDTTISGGALTGTVDVTNAVLAGGQATSIGTNAAPVGNVYATTVTATTLNGTLAGSNVTGGIGAAQISGCCVSVAAGGTGAATPLGARTNLGAEAQSGILDNLAAITAGGTNGSFLGFVRAFAASGAVAFDYSALFNTDIPAFTGATAAAAGTNGGVPMALAGQQSFYLRGDGTWADPASFSPSSISGSGASVDTYSNPDYIQFNVAGAEQMRITGTLGATSSLAVTGSAVDATGPVISVYSTHSNVGLELSSLGSGNLSLATGYGGGGADLTVSGATGAVSAAYGFVGTLSGNASSASALAPGASIALSGDATATGVNFTGAAGITLATTVAKLQGQSVAATAPSEGQVLTYHSGAWSPLAASLPGSGTIGATSGVDLELLAGTAALPALAFYSDLTTGIYYGGTDVLAFSTKGTPRGDFDASGNFNLASGAYEIGGGAIVAVPAADSAYSLALGQGALAHYTGSANAANTGVGASALAADISGGNNTGVGASALLKNVSGLDNSALGAYAGMSLTSGGDNILLGYEAGNSLSDGGHNIVLGEYGPLVHGSGNIQIGNSVSDIADGSDQLDIGDTIYGKLSDAAGGTALTIGVAGDTGTVLTITGNNATSLLVVNGGAEATSFTPLSDARLKKNIVPIGGSLALVEKLTGVRYDWRLPAERSVGKEISLPVTQRQIGLIAQDVEKVFPEAVVIGSNGLRTVNYNGLVGALVEAIKDVAAKWRTLSRQVAELARAKVGILARLDRDDARFEEMAGEISSLQVENARLEARLARQQNLLETRLGTPEKSHPRKTKNGRDGKES